MQLTVRRPEAEPGTYDAYLNPGTLAELGAADGGPVVVAGRKLSVAVSRADPAVPEGDVVLPAGVRRNTGSGPGDAVDVAVESLGALATLELRPQGANPPDADACRRALQAPARPLR